MPNSQIPYDGIYRGRRVLVTGHTGFKGAWLTALLIELGAEVIGYSLEPPTNPSLFAEAELSKRISHNIGDVRDLKGLSRVVEKSAPEIIFHLAAQPLVRLSYAEPVATLETNIMGTVNILEAARRVSSVRSLVVITSDKCYENREWEYAYREIDAMGGHDPYSASKGCAELVTSSYARSFLLENGTNVATARAGNVIGGGDWAPDRILPDCINALRSGNPIIVRNPDATRPFQHVLEPLNGYLMLAAQLFGDSSYAGAYNFGPGSGGQLRVRDLVNLSIEEWGEGTWISPETSGPHEAHNLSLDCSKAMTILGWKPVFDAKESIRRSVAWYRRFYQGESSAAELLNEDVKYFLGAFVPGKLSTDGSARFGGI
jgi:CDP-glucose 4,6-dehydratase